MLVSPAATSHLKVCKRCSGINQKNSDSVFVATDGQCLNCGTVGETNWLDEVVEAAIRALDRKYEPFKQSAGNAIGSTRRLTVRAIARQDALKDILPNAGKKVMAAIQAVADKHHDDRNLYKLRTAVGSSNPRWQKFCVEIKERARFFSTLAWDELSDVFQNLESMRTSDGRSVIKDVGPGSPIESLYRSRLALTPDKVRSILRAPGQQLGPPTSNHSGSGRMNPRGVPVFYGSMSMNSCVSELRPPVGSIVIVGRFTLLRPLRLLDLSSLEQALEAKASPFDSEYSNLVSRQAFLSAFADVAQRPVLLGDSLSDYLPTQVVAEYLSEQHRLNLDGIIFPSTQRPSGAHNVVLFNHACALDPATERLTLPHLMTRSDDTMEQIANGIVWVEQRTSVAPTTVPGPSRAPVAFRGSPTLLLDPTDVTVTRITSVDYHESSVNFRRAPSRALHSAPAEP